MTKDLEPIARVVHEAVRAWSIAHEQDALPAWSEAPEWMRSSTRQSVQFVLDHPEAGPDTQHEEWVRQRRADGWTFGPVRDEALKQHPMLIPFSDLPRFEQQKDALVCAIVKALTYSDVS